MTDNTPKKTFSPTEFTREGDLLYIQNRVKEIEDFFGTPKVKEKDMYFLELAALISRYKENFGPSRRDVTLQRMLALQKRMDTELKNTFYSEMIDAIEQKRQNRRTVVADKDLLVEVVDLIKRYKEARNPAAEDHLLIRLDNIAWDLRLSIQGGNYIDRMIDEYNDRFELAADSEAGLPCVEFHQEVFDFVKQLKKRQGFSSEEIAKAENFEKEIKQRIRDYVQQTLPAKLAQVSQALAIDDSSKNLKRLIKEVKGYWHDNGSFLAETDEVAVFCQNLLTELNSRLDAANDSLFQREIAAIKRQLLYSRKKTDFVRLIEKIAELKQVCGGKGHLTPEQEKLTKELNQKISDKMQESDREEYEQRFADLKELAHSQDGDEAKSIILSKLGFLIREYDIKFAQDKLFEQMRKFETELRG